MTYKPPIPYYGSKQKLAPSIISLMPEHWTYVEPFAGSLAVLLAKPPAQLEVVNDLDNRLMTFWRVVRNRPDELYEVCYLTPHSREEFRLAKAEAPTDDELEIARQVWVRLTQAANVGWKVTNSVRSSGPINVKNRFLKRIGPAAERLLTVVLENKDAIEIIEKYGRKKDPLMYVDPPYLAYTRVSGTEYRTEFKDEQSHRALLKALQATPAKVILSGYPNPLYDEELAGWASVEIETPTRGAPKIEKLWLNYTPPRCWICNNAHQPPYDGSCLL